MERERKVLMKHNRLMIKWKKELKETERPAVADKNDSSSKVYKSFMSFACAVIGKIAEFGALKDGHIYVGMKSG
ncbi:unnamed protein product [Sphenostylis stenocarpa]|uniref:Uncharacterized protein n=1 Tax=Sphenostylis stenocarpa TaxID=92480 RepID=A0AA86VAQ6_9FABA|nr:unnamed protein product [Sphenostylis stenocarpa]